MATPQLPPMADLTGYRLIKVGERLLEAADEALATIAVKARHLNVLVTVKAHPDMSQQELSTLIGIDVNGMVVAIDYLEKHGLAVRARNPRDRRRHVVRLTTKGEQIVRRGGQLVAACENEFLMTLTAAEREELRRLTGLLLRIDTDAQAAPAGAPAREELAVAPATEELAVAPATEELAVVPATEELAVVPATEELAVVPATEELAVAGNV